VIKIGYAKEIETQKIYYNRNVKLKIDQYCHECESHCTGLKKKYPTIMRNGKQYNVHRWVFLQVHGYLPETVMHLCDNKKCVNPKHLKAGTASENAKDMIRKNRGKSQFLSGENHINAKLTNLQVSEIKKLIKAGAKNKDIAIKYNTPDYNISKIRNNKRWSV